MVSLREFIYCLNKMAKFWIFFLSNIFFTGAFASVMLSDDVTCATCINTEVIFCCGTCHEHYCCNNKTLALDGFSCLQSPNASLPVTTFMGLGIGLVATFIFALLLHKALRFLINKLRPRQAKQNKDIVVIADDPPSYEDHEMYRKNECKNGTRESNNSNIYVIPFESKCAEPPNYDELSIHEPCDGAQVV